MYAVGDFSKIIGYDAQTNSMATFQRSNAFSFSATPPFAVSDWDPDVAGDVNSIAVRGTNCSVAYLGGHLARSMARPSRTSLRSARRQAA